MLQLDKIRLAVVSALLLLGAVDVVAKTPDGRAHANIPPRPSVPVVAPPEGGPVTSRNGTQLPPYNTTYYFDQLIDHSNPSLGTFKQRFWHTAEFYEKGQFTLLRDMERNSDIPLTRWPHHLDDAWGGERSS